MTKHKRAAAVCLTLILIAMIALTLIVTIAEADHACTGAECDICRIVTMINGIIRSIAAVAVIYILICVCAIGSAYPITPTDLMTRNTPVSDKIKLLD